MRSDISISRRRLLQAGALAGVSAFAGGLVGAERAYAGSHPFTPNQALLNAFIARRGGSIGTGGKPAVAFRCDHHLNRFASMLLPLHRKYNIPVTLAFGSQVLKREVGHDGSHLLTFPGIEKMSLENGFEIANHGATHQGAVTSAEIRAEFVYSKRDLQKAMPRLPIEIFSPAGVGKTSFGGFYGARTQTDYERCLAGRIIVQNHAMATGYVPGYWAMTGDPLDSMGAVHINIENAAYANRGPQFVRASAIQGRGVDFMYHPSLIDSTDLPAIENFFAWCAAERDAGRLEILTTSGLMMANHQSTARHNMLSARTSFQSGWNGWNGAPAEWALQTESGTRHARRGSKSTPLIKDIPVGAYVGSTRQLRINMRSSGGVRVTFEVMDASSTTRLNIIRDVTLAPSAVFGPTHQYLTVPLTGTSQLRIRITPRSGGDLHVREPELLAA